MGLIGLLTRNRTHGERDDLRRLNRALSALTTPFAMPNFESARIKAYFNVFKAYLYLASDAASQGRGSDERERLQNARNYGEKIGLYVSPEFSTLLRMNLGLPKQTIDLIVADQIESHADNLLSETSQLANKMFGPGKMEEKAQQVDQAAEYVANAAVFYRLAGKRITEEKAAVFYRVVEEYFDQIIRDAITKGTPTMLQEKPKRILEIGRKLALTIEEETGPKEPVEIYGILQAMVYGRFSSMINEVLGRAFELGTEYKSRRDERSKDASIEWLTYAKDVAHYFDVNIARRVSEIEAMIAG